MAIDARWRKTTDVNRTHAVFELVHDGKILLDVGFSREDVLEIAFHEGVSNTVVGWDSFFYLLDQGRKLAEGDKGLTN
ncbi:MAG: hypothetical protein ABW199_08190 [Caulobacterales bacterium]